MYSFYFSLKKRRRRRTRNTSSTVEAHSAIWSGPSLRSERPAPNQQPSSSSNNTQGNVPEKKKRINIYSSFFFFLFFFFVERLFFLLLFRCGRRCVCVCTCVSCWLAAILTEDGGPFPRPGLRLPYKHAPAVAHTHTEELKGPALLGLLLLLLPLSLFWLILKRISPEPDSGRQKNLKRKSFFEILNVLKKKKEKKKKSLRIQVPRP